MDEILLKYIAKKFMEDVRRGRTLDEALCDALRGYPEIEYLREVVLPEDSDDIIDLCKSKNDTVLSLAFGLLHPLAKTKKVKEFIKNLWEELTDYSVRMKLLWRLLDNPDLDIEIHRSLYSFVRENHDRFMKDTAKWVKGDVMTYVKNRLEDNRFPESKAWIYLLVASSTEENIDSLLKQYENSDASIVAEVVKDLREKRAMHSTSAR